MGTKLFDWVLSNVMSLYNWKYTPSKSFVCDWVLRSLRSPVVLIRYGSASVPLPSHAYAVWAVRVSRSVTSSIMAARGEKDVMVFFIPYLFLMIIWAQRYKEFC